MNWLRSRFLGGYIMLLITAIAPCHADSPQNSVDSSCTGDCDPVGLIDDHWQPGIDYPSRLVPRQARSDSAPVAATHPRAVMEWQPPDTHWYTKLRGMRELRLVTLWESHAARVFLGVSERGVPGIALSSRRMPRSRSIRRSDDAHDWRRQQASLIRY